MSIVHRWISACGCGLLVVWVILRNFAGAYLDAL